MEQLVLVLDYEVMIHSSSMIVPGRDEMISIDFGKVEKLNDYESVLHLNTNAEQLEVEENEEKLVFVDLDLEIHVES